MLVKRRKPLSLRFKVGDLIHLIRCHDVSSTYNADALDFFIKCVGAEVTQVSKWSQPEIQLHQFCFIGGFRNDGDEASMEDLCHLWNHEVDKFLLLISAGTSAQDVPTSYESFQFEF